MGFLYQSRTHELLSALGEQLSARAVRVELVVIGGSALLAVGLISRSTRDVDIVAVISGWTRTHDPSEGFLEQLVAAMAYLGVHGVDLDS